MSLWNGRSDGAQLQLTWTDNSSNEDGFKIERGAASTGPFSRIATVLANVSSFTDSGLADGASFCYRVSAFNSTGDSPYSNVTCSTTTTTTATLAVTKTGAGSGTVTSTPLGINCGSACSATYNSGAFVTLTATPAAGSVFGGWSGDSDCLDGSVTMNVSKSCTAAFRPQTFTLSINPVNTITSAGTGSGTVTSLPAGINCGSACSAIYNNGTSVTLTATPAAGSVFAGWGGGCSGTGTCVVQVTSNISVTATFAPRTFTLTVNKIGNGTVTSSTPGINCGAVCSAAYPSGASVTLTAIPAPNSIFLGWNGIGCSGTAPCSIVVTGNTSITASFSARMATAIGIYRSSTEEWLLDLNGNGAFDGCGIDACIGPFGKHGNLPLVGFWNGSVISLLGVFDPSTANWYLDLNGNGSLDGCELDSCRYVFGQPGDLPVVGDWTGNGRSRIGIFQAGKWDFDINGNGGLDNCKIDICSKLFGLAGDLPVVGDWTGSGQDKIGLFRPSTGQWILDVNGNMRVNSCNRDGCSVSFGLPGDLPVVGDWDGSGKTRIGVFRPSTGEWLLDVNGNRQWDGCSVDACLSFGEPGDRPVVGKW